VFLGPVHPGMSGVDNIDQNFYQNYACGAALNVIARRVTASTPGTLIKRGKYAPPIAAQFCMREITARGQRRRMPPPNLIPVMP
jgi:hypothetical protein